MNERIEYRGYIIIDRGVDVDIMLNDKIVDMEFSVKRAQMIIDIKLDGKSNEQ